MAGITRLHAKTYTHLSACMFGRFLVRVEFTYLASDIGTQI